MKFILLILLLFTVSGHTQEDKNNILREDVQEYLASVVPPYNSVYFAGYDLALVLQKISQTKWKSNDDFKLLARYYAILYIRKSACFDAVYYKKAGFSYEKREKLRAIKNTLKALMFNTGEKYKRFVKFNKLLSGKTYPVIVASEENLDKIISKYCSKGVKDYLKYE